MSVVLLADMKRFGNFKETTSDTDLQTTIDVAEVIAARWVGPLASTAVTQRIFDASLSSVLVLNTRPVVSVTSVTGSDGGVVPLANLDVDLANGVIYPDTTGCLNRWPLARYTVVYQAGWVTVPGDIKLGIMEMVKSLWKSRRPAVRQGGETPDTPPYMSSHADLPMAVRALWDPYIRLGIG